MFNEHINELEHNASIGIHHVSPEGLITFANQCELETLGYSPEEYIGHRESKFHLDNGTLGYQLRSMTKFRCLKDYPSIVQGKKGLKYVIQNSIAIKKDNKFSHTRFYTMEVPKFVYDAYLDKLNLLGREELYYEI